MYCKNCYKIIPDDIDVCPSCGQKAAYNINKIAIICISMFVVLSLSIVVLSKVVKPKMTDTGSSVDIYSLPHSVDYNGVPVVIEEITPYQLYSDYKYSLHLVIKLDVSELSTEQLHWLVESDIKIHSFISHEKNEILAKTMSRIGPALSEENNLYYIYKLGEWYRYDFSNVSIFADIEVKQEDTYTFNTGTRVYHKINKVNYVDHDVQSVQSHESMPVNVLVYVTKQILETLDS